MECRLSNTTDNLMNRFTVKKMLDLNFPQIYYLAVVPLFALLVAAIWTDIRSHRISNRLIFIGAVTGLILNGLLPIGAGFISALPGALGIGKSLAGFALGFGLLMPMYLLRAMAAGDVKLIAMTGAYLGPNAIIGIILLTFVVGGMLSIFVVMRRKTLGLLVDNLRTMLTLSFIKGSYQHRLPTLDAAAMSAGKLPYAVAIVMGTLLYVGLELDGRLTFLKVF